MTFDAHDPPVAPEQPTSYLEAYEAGKAAGAAEERQRIVTKLRDLAVEFPRLSDVSADLRWVAERIESEASSG